MGESVDIFKVIFSSGLVVQFVLYSLVLASVFSWTVIFLKMYMYKRASNENKSFLEIFWNAKSMDNIFEESKNFSSSPVSNVFRAGFVEFKKISARASESTQQQVIDAGLDNVQRTLRKASVNEALRLEKNLSVLASVASVAPFVGLFGTVWGIMNSFHMLGLGGPATLQRVAPGLSEALIATAIGLAAAIPAVLAYNAYIQKVRRFSIEVDNFNVDFTNILKRNYLG